MNSPLKKSFAAEQLKRQRQKKRPVIIAILVVAVIIAVIAIGYALYSRFGIKEEPTEEKITSIAILPFDDMSLEKDQEWFCDGIVEGIINALSNASGLQVKGRTSSFAFKGKDTIIQEIGRQLNVDAILEGSIMKSGNLLRITAQLIKVSDGFHIWSEEYDRTIKDVSDVFDIRDDIALAIVNALKVKLLNKEKTAIEKRPTENIEAYNLYLMGSFYQQRREEEKAYEYFQKAVEKDPDFALAYAGLAEVYTRLGNYKKAKEAVEKALELDNTLPEAHAALGMIKLYYDWEWAEGERVIKRALELNPGSVIAHFRYSGYLMIMGRFDEALEECKYILELDPLWFMVYERIINNCLYLEKYDEAKEYIDKALAIDPESTLILGQLSVYYRICFDLGRYDEGKEYIDKELAIDPDNTRILGLLWWYYSLQGNYTQALELNERLRELAGITEPTWWTSLIYTFAGKRDKAEQIFQKLKEQNKLPSSWWMAQVHLVFDETEKALEYFEKAYDNHEEALIWIKWYTIYHEPVRSDPRYKALLKKMGLPEE